MFASSLEMGVLSRIIISLIITKVRRSVDQCLKAADNIFPVRIKCLTIFFRLHLWRKKFSEPNLSSETLRKEEVNK